MSQDQNISQHVKTDEQWRSHHEGFEKGFPTFSMGGGSMFPPYRLVVVSLGLLNALLIIAAAVIGVYCAKAQDVQVLSSAARPFLLELNYLRSNQTEMIRTKMEMRASLLRERANHMHLEQQVKMQKVVMDVLQRQIETLAVEKTDLMNNITNLEGNCGKCPPGWSLLKSSCYYFPPVASTIRKNWSDSRADCLSHGSDLVVINNLAEQILVNENFQQLSVRNNIWWRNSFWIGLTDVAAPGTWVWVNNVTEVETMYWKEGQPSNREDQTGNCAASFYLTDHRRTWLNANCQDHLLPWVCEMEPK